MFHRILIPTDFSTASEWAFDDAVRIAAVSGAELIVLHVRMTWSRDPHDLRLPADESLYEYVEKQELEKLRERIRRANAAVLVRMIVRNAPDPGAEILRTAREEKADLIVMATHARHHVAHLLIGSTTFSVLMAPPAPLLAIRYGTRKRTSLQRAVVPVDLQDDSPSALSLAVKLTPEVHLVAVAPRNERPRAEALLRAASALAPQAKTAILESDDIAREIVRYAEKQNADAIFLSAAATPAETNLEILRHAPVPVMIVP